MPVPRAHKPQHPHFEDQVIDAFNKIIQIKSLPQTTVARLTGMAQPYVSALLSRHKQTNWSNIIDILPSLGVDVEVILRDPSDGQAKLKMTFEATSTADPDLASVQSKSR